ncbi:MAG TPA: hypothetical protein IGS53_07095 [Leptolyngbyaceae cyanobacterium M33_DOE_097]|uniref:Uncharacterized protein n=1 Tax=Oscillatoriales cyanobacterium SpSt-418 TaxID=2282169 RepID=A0A7C3KKX2_9CYAN|nr:hypothetical protein [Leptolyngbyaceae cyanobacterium M33_DOE_097]
MNGNLPFFITLATGLLVAFSIQLLLSVLALAIGITSADHLFTQQPTADSIIASKAKKTNVPFSLGVCFLTITNIALFTACFLAVRLSNVVTLDHGAILGVVIWSAHLLIFAWLSSVIFRAVVGSTAKLLEWSWQSLKSIARTLFGKDQEDTSVDLNLNLQDDLIYLLKKEAERLPSLAAEKSSDSYDDLNPSASNELQNTETADEASSTEKPNHQNQIIELLSKYLREEINQEEKYYSSLPEVIKKLSHQLEQVRDRLMGDTDSSQQTEIAAAQELWIKLLDYLRERGNHINTTNLEAHLEAFFQDIDKNFEIYPNLPSFERKAVKQALKDRQELSKKEIKQACDRIEKVWNTFSLEIKEHSAQVEEKPNSAIDEILEGLQKYLEDLDWNVLREDFLEKLKQPQIAAVVPRMINQIDWGTIVKQIPAVEESITTPARQLARQVYETATNAGDTSQDWVVDKVHQIKHNATEQVNIISKQTQQQLRVTQQTTVTVLWWLIAITFSSLLMSAIAGILAVAI